MELFARASKELVAPDRIFKLRLQCCHALLRKCNQAAHFLHARGHS